MRHSLFLMLALAPTPLFAQTAIGVGGAFFFEDSDLSGEQQASVQTTDESFAYDFDDSVKELVLNTMSKRSTG